MSEGERIRERERREREGRGVSTLYRRMCFRCRICKLARTSKGLRQEEEERQEERREKEGKGKGKGEREGK